MLQNYKVNPSDVIHKNTKLVIDFDSMLFKLASSAEKKNVKITRKDTNEEIGVFKNKTEFLGRARKSISVGCGLHKYNQELEKKGQDPLTFDDFEIEEEKVAVVGYSTMFNNMEAWIDGICAAVNLPRENVVYLMGDSGSFRDDLVLPKKYKDNRDPNSKPIMLSKLRQKFAEKYNPFMDENFEADDVIGMYQFKGYVSYLKTGKTDYIVSTIDKDAYGTAGFVVNYDKANGEFKDTSLIKIPHAEKDVGCLFKKKDDVKGLGFKWFIYQALLIGDSGDNYFTYQYFPELKGAYGKNSALEETKDLNTPKEILEYAVGKWKSWFPDGYVEFTDYQGNHVHEPWYEFANKIFLAAYMKRSMTDDMDLYKLLDKFEVEL